MVNFSAYLIEVGIYAMFAVLLSALAWAAARADSQRCRGWWLAAMVATFAAIAGARWQMGSDWMYYARKFCYGTDATLLAGAPLWRAAVNGLHALGAHWSVGLAACAAVQLGFLICAMRRWPWALVALPLVMFGGRYWGDMMGAVRQMMVACALVWALPWLYTRRGGWKFAAFVAVSTLIHEWSILLVALLALRWWRIPPQPCASRRRQVWLTAGLLTAVAVGRLPLNALALPAEVWILRAVGATEYLPKLAVLATDPQGQALAFGPMMLSYLLTALILIWLPPFLVRCNSRAYSPMLVTVYRVAYIYAVGYFTMCNMGHLAIRPWLFLAPAQMVLAAWCLALLWRQRQRALCLTAAAVIAAGGVWDVCKATNEAAEFTLYKSWIGRPDRLDERWLWIPLKPTDNTEAVDTVATASTTVQIPTDCEL